MPNPWRDLLVAAGAPVVLARRAADYRPHGPVLIPPGLRVFGAVAALAFTRGSTAGR